MLVRERVMPEFPTGAMKSSRGDGRARFQFNSCVGTAILGQCHRLRKMFAEIIGLEQRSTDYTDFAEPHLTGVICVICGTRMQLLLGRRVRYTPRSFSSRVNPKYG